MKSRLQLNKLGVNAPFLGPLDPGIDGVHAGNILHNPNEVNKVPRNVILRWVPVRKRSWNVEVNSRKINLQVSAP